MRKAPISDAVESEEYPLELIREEDMHTDIRNIIRPGNERLKWGFVAIQRLTILLRQLLLSWSS